jgi:hypothetical protein
MVITDIYHIPTGISLAVIGVTLTIAMIASLMRAKKLERESGAVDPTTLHPPQDPPV